MSDLASDTSALPTGRPVRVEDALTIGIAVPAVPRLLWVALAVGVLCDLALRSGSASLGGALLVAGTAAALLTSGRLRTPQSRYLIAAAPLFGGWLALRTSDWLLPLDVLAALALLVLGASLSSGGSMFDLTLPAVVQRAGVTAIHGLGVPSFLRPAVPWSTTRTVRHSAVPALRGIALAVPVLVLLGGLLASADAVFASIFRVDVDAGGLVSHTLFVGLGAWTLLALLRAASAEPVGPRPPVRQQLGRTELTVVLVSVAGLFGSFAVTQMYALSDGGRHVLDTSGLTYAEYARSGFFQLLWVAALTVALLLAVRAVTGEDESTRRRFVAVGEAVVVLTLVIVMVAIRRLNLYQDAFGLTMLRLYCTIFAIWVGLVIVGLGATIAGVGRARTWLPGAAAVVGLALLLGLNIVNPEAVVVRHNLDRVADGRAVDSEYLAEGLSLDAVPIIIDLLPALDPLAQADLLDRIGCPAPGNGWAGWNASRSAAARAVAEWCQASGT